MSVEELRRKVLDGDWSSETLRRLADAQDVAAKEEETKRLCEIGRRVRVRRGRNKSMRGMISSVNEDTVELVFDDDSEGVVAKGDVRALEEFEEDDEDDPFRLKERGSKLFGLNDYYAARIEYNKCLELLRKRVEVGSTVMVNSNGSLKIGTASSVEDATIDVVYEDGTPDDDDMSRKRILEVLPHSQDERRLMLTTYLNVARCEQHLEESSPRAVTCCTLAGGIARYDQENALFVTSRVLRARAHLKQSHLKQAIRDCNSANEFAAQGDAAVAALNRDVDRAKKIALKANKKLAKEVSDWVSVAMAKSNNTTEDDL